MKKGDKAEIVLFRITRAKETLNEVDLHVQNELWNTAVNRIYYACFYAVLALLAENDIETKTHAGARQMQGLHFIKTGLIPEESGEFYSDLFAIRQSGEYEDLIIFEKDEVLPLLQPARTLIAEIEQILSNK